MTVVLLDAVLPPAASWARVCPAGTALTLTDVAGGGNVSALLYRADAPLERYCTPDTLKAQHVCRVTAGTALYSDMGRVLASVVHDTCGWHDTICGHLTAEMVSARYGAVTYQERGNAWRRSAREAFLVELAKHGLGARDLVANLNLFSRVQPDADGTLTFVRSHSPAGAEVTLRCELDVLVVLANVPHPLDPAPDWSPGPVGLRLAAADRVSAGDAVRTACPENERGFAATEADGRGVATERPGDRPAVWPPPALARRARFDDHPLDEKARSTAEPGAGTRLDLEVPAGEGWCGVVAAGETLRIVDLHGNQAADTLFFDAHDHANRYSAVDTIAAQRSAYLTTGTPLLALDGRPLMTITADTCGRHDTLGGACSQESNVVRYGEHTRHMHACRNTFLAQALAWGDGLDKRDLTANVNFFMNVPLTPDGGLTFADGISAPGRHVDLRAERDTLVLISNCPQLNNPCNGYDPTPIGLRVWTSAPASARAAAGLRAVPS